MIPAWKLKRELTRFREQIWGAYGKQVADRRTRTYDSKRGSALIRTNGNMPLMPKVAVFLIYQPGDLARSILDNCEALIAEGFSPLIISNTPLSDASIAQLKPLSWRIVQRPNFGYDFGGYREGVMQLLDDNITPDELIIMNDSVWVIQPNFTKFMKKIRALRAGLTGNVTREKNGKVWIESYFFLVSQHTFQSTAFQDYWRNYRLVDSKYVVIRQGERDFSVTMAQNGIDVSTHADNANFCAYVDHVASDELELALRYFNDEDSVAVSAAQTLLTKTARDENWGNDVRAFISKRLTKRLMWMPTFPVLGHVGFGNPFIKKGRSALAVGWRTQILNAITAGHMPPIAPAILDEIKEQNGKGIIAGPQWVSNDRK